MDLCPAGGACLATPKKRVPDHGQLGKSLTLSLVRQVQHVGIVGRLDGNHIIILCALQYLGQTAQVDTQRHRSIATVFSETNCVQFYGDERHVRVVHGLEVNAFFVAFEVGVCNQLFDGWTLMTRQNM